MSLFPRAARRRLSCLAALASTAAVLAGSGCSSRIDAEGTGPGAALARVSAKPRVPNEVTYADAVRIRALEKADQHHYSSVMGLGSALLGQYSFRGTLFGIDTSDITESVSASNPLNAETWRGHFDAKDITAKMRKQGLKAGRRDGETVMSGKDESYVVTDTALSYARTPAALAGVRPADGASVADRSDSKAMLGCLDDKPYIVDFEYPTANKAVPAYAVADYAPKAGQDSETLCAVTKDRATANARAAALRAGLARDRSARGAKVTVITKAGRTMVKAEIPTVKSTPLYLVRNFPIYMRNLLAD